MGLSYEPFEQRQIGWTLFDPEGLNSSGFDLLESKIKTKWNVRGNKVLARRL